MVWSNAWCFVLVSFNAQGTYVQVIPLKALAQSRGAASLPAHAWTWRECAALCAQHTLRHPSNKCEFWTLQQTTQTCLLQQGMTGPVVARGIASHIEGPHARGCRAPLCSQLATDLAQGGAGVTASDAAVLELSSTAPHAHVPVHGYTDVDCWTPATHPTGVPACTKWDTSGGWHQGTPIARLGRRHSHIVVASRVCDHAHVHVFVQRTSLPARERVCRYT